jgi:hypothetical protein
METTYNELPAKAKRFLTQLSDYLGIPLLYYGSVQRTDFFVGHSDIDVDIFTDNDESTLNMMQQFMKRPAYKFKKVAWRLHDSKQMVYGHKTMYTDPEEEFKIEFSIYNERFKKNVLAEHVKKTVLPWYCTVVLLILKTLHYKMGIFPDEIFSYLKNKTLTLCIGEADAEFVSIEPSNTRGGHGEEDEIKKEKEKEPKGGLANNNERDIYEIYNNI